MKVGLVLGAGGTAGFAYHSATLAAINHLTGWDPRTAHTLIGTSAGAGVGSVIRAGVKVEAVLDRLFTMPTNPEALNTLRTFTQSTRPSLRWWYGSAAPKLLAVEALTPWRMRPGRIAAAALPEGILPTSVLGDRARTLHAGGWPRQPFWVPAVRLTDGDRVVFGQDPEYAHVTVADAVEASCAIPGVFRPRTIDDVRFVDGGVHSATNADLLVDVELDLVIVSAPLSAPLGTAIRVPAAAARIFFHLQLENEIAQLRRAGHRVLVIEPSLADLKAMGSTMLDPTRSMDIVVQASTSALQQLRKPRVQPLLDILRRATEAPSPPPAEPAIS